MANLIKLNSTSISQSISVAHSLTSFDLITTFDLLRMMDPESSEQQKSKDDTEQTSSFGECPLCKSILSKSYFYEHFRKVHKLPPGHGQKMNIVSAQAAILYSAKRHKSNGDEEPTSRYRECPLCKSKLNKACFSKHLQRVHKLPPEQGHKMKIVSPPATIPSSVEQQKSNGNAEQTSRYRECPLCKNVLIKNHTERHFRRVHKLPHGHGHKMKMVSDPAALPRTGKCPLCKTITRSIFFDRHVRSIHGLEADHNLQLIIDPEIEQPKPEEEINEGETSYMGTCPLCQVRMRVRHFRRHVREIHHQLPKDHQLQMISISGDPKIKKKSQPILECPVCKKSMRGNLDRHLLTHDGSKRSQLYQCKDCSNVYASERTLKDHRNLVHLKERQFCCPVCEKGFLNRSQVTVHMNHVHLKVKKCECQYCGKKFPQCQNLAKHIQNVHMKLKPYVCEICGDYFAQTSSLGLHQKNKHNITRKPRYSNRAVKQEVVEPLDNFPTQPLPDQVVEPQQQVAACQQVPTVVGLPPVDELPPVYGFIAQQQLTAHGYLKSE